MIFREFENYWLLVAIDERLHIVSREDLAECAFVELFVNDKTVVQEEALHLFDDGDRAMLLAALLEDFVHFVLGVHL